MSAIRALILMLCLQAANAQPAFDAKPWQEDLEQAREAVATKYANLEWLVLEREINLESLFAEAKTSINSASDADDARAAFDRLARQFGDGHVRFKWPQGASTSGTPLANCQALGYELRMRGVPLATHVPGYTALSAGPESVFPTGAIQLSNRKVGVIKIGLFSPQAYPELCAAAIADLHIEPNAPCDDACSRRIDTWAVNRMSYDLANQLRAIKASGAEILLLDIANNGGGSDWAEAAARMVTSVGLRSERMGFVRGPHWVRDFSEMETDLRSAMKGATTSDRKELAKLADAVAARRREANTPCDSAPLWRGARPACSWLGEGFYSSGLLPSGDIQSIRNKAWPHFVFSPARYPVTEGVWTGRCWCS